MRTYRKVSVPEVRARGRLVGDSLASDHFECIHVHTEGCEYITHSIRQNGVPAQAGEIMEAAYMIVRSYDDLKRLDRQLRRRLGADELPRFPETIKETELGPVPVIVRASRDGWLHR